MSEDIKRLESDWLEAQAEARDNPEDADLHVAASEAKQALVDAVAEMRQREGRVGFSVTTESEE